MFIVYILISLLGIVYYEKHSFTMFLMIMTFLVFDFFGIFGDYGLSDYSSDIMVIMVASILVIEFFKGSKPLQLSGDIIGKTIMLLLLWIVLRFCYSVIIGEEQFLYGVKVIRHDLFLLSYFILRKINVNSYTKYFKLMLPVILCVGAISFAMLISGFTTSGSLFQRKAILTISAPLLFMLISGELKVNLRWVYVGVLLFFMGMTMARGFFLASCFAIAVYYWFLKKISIKNVFVIVPLFLILLFAYSRIEKSQVEGGKESVISELTDASRMSSYQDFKEGSFLLRFAMTWERLEYLNNTPNAMIFGVGTIHEDSPNNSFTFRIGSAKELHGDYRRQMIDTDDVAIISHWFRYGLVYVLLFVLFLTRCFKKVLEKKANCYMKTLLMLLITMSVSMVSLDSFSRSNRFIIALMLLSMLFQYYKSNNSKTYSCQ